MDNQPAIKDIIKAHFDVIPVLMLMMLISMAVAIVRFIWGLSNGWGVIESAGFFTPWAMPWLIAMIAALAASVYTSEINKRADDIFRKRKSQEYAARH